MGLFTNALQLTMWLVVCLMLPPHHHTKTKINPANQSGDLPQVREATKPIVLLWFWPENKQFPLSACRRLYDIDDCRLTANRSKLVNASAVIIHHAAINRDLSNLPKTRSMRQRWIWLNMDPPSQTHHIRGLRGVFNLTLTYKRTSDIHAGPKVVVRLRTDEPFRLPLKTRTVCWVLERQDEEGSGSYQFFKELSQHIKVDMLYKSSAELQGDGYFSVIGSCKFYLSFETSVHTNFVTEGFMRLLAAGTVPVVWGQPRKNYEKLAPSTSFIHVSDFSSTKRLASFLQSMDSDLEAYKKYFEWWKFFKLQRHPTDGPYKYAHAVCQACRHVALDNRYRVVVTDPYEWFLK